MSSQLSAIELLKLGEADRKRPWINQYWGQTLGVFLGVSASCFMNYQTRRPPFSGLQKHVLLSLAFGSILTYVQKKREDYFAEKDAVYRHYIELHPEDFPTPEHKKISDILEPWIPVR